MLTEIDVKIIIDETTMSIVETRIGVAVSSPIPYETMDYLLLDTFHTLATRLKTKIENQNQNKQLN